MNHGILANRQADELHKSIIAYLSANNLSTAADTLRAELSLGDDVFDVETTAKYQPLPEKNWTSVVRLQKKALMYLESVNSVLQSEVDSATSSPNPSKRNQNPTSWLPRSPPRHLLESHQATVNCLAFHPIFSSLASGCDDSTVKIWDWELGELERMLKGHTKAVLDVDYGGPRGCILLASCSSDSTIKLWDPADEYKNIGTLVGHDHSVSAVRFLTGSSGTKNLLVSASGDKTLKLWDIAAGYCVRTLQDHIGWVRDVCPSPGGRSLLSAGSDQMARLWDISAVANPKNELVMAGHENGICCCAFAPAASYGYLASLAGLNKPPPAPSTAEFMATGPKDKTVKLWDARGVCFKKLVGHDNWVNGTVFHPGGKYLLSVADDKTLRCWDLSQDGRCVKVLADTDGQFITCLRWAPGIVKKEAEQTDDDSGELQIRCLAVTGSVDRVVRIFAN
ncbi:LIS-1 2 [Corynascus novoguineensis]|uniref:Nuclear distribution protein PAC1 n=1 Tax=Corynascus novoguineensis TaxID=1126955 RepID=A0AAN7CRD3_9PEZI|nr:LIS-1 2 [Corynascus novoguineensis]